MPDEHKRRRTGTSADVGYKKYLGWLPLLLVLVAGVMAWADSQSAISEGKKTEAEQRALLEQHEKRIREGEIQRAVLQQQVKTINDNVKETKLDVKEILRKLN